MSRLLVLLLVACGSDSQPADGGIDATTPDVADEPDAATEDVAEEPFDAGPTPILWASSYTTLYTFDPLTHVLAKVIDFTCNGEGVLNIAVDRDDHLYATTTESLVSIDKKTGVCYQIAKGQYPRALGFVPGANLGEANDVLLGYDYVQLVRIDTKTGKMSFAGALNPNPTGVPYTVSGNLVSIAGGKTFITGLGDPSQGDALLEVTLDGGKVIDNLGYTGIDGLVGLAQWAGTVYAFGVNGRIYTVSKTGVPTQVYPSLDAGTPDADAGDADAAALSFLGAAVTTLAPP